MGSLLLLGAGGKGAAGAGGGGGSAWTPADLGTALRAWYKFDTLTGSNNDPIGAVTDAGANGFNLTQTGGNRPTLQVAEQNSLNTLRFTAISAQHYVLSNSILSGSSAGSVYIVYKIVSDAANNGLMDWGTSGSESHWPFSDGNLYIDFGSTVRKTVGNPSVTQTSYRIISLYSAASDWAFYIDGGAGGSSGGTSPFFSTATNTVGWNATAGAVKLGCSAPVTPAALNGWIAEVIFSNAKQSVQDRQKMEGYLADKWGLTGNLDSTHPYKTTPPATVVPFSSVKLLLGFNGTNGSTGAPGMADESAAAHGTATVVTGATISTAQSVFGGSSLALNGSGYITFPDHNDWNLSTQPFTIEFRFRTTTTAGTQLIVGQWDSLPSWGVFGGVNISFLVTTNGVTPVTAVSGGTVAINTWYAVCVDFDGTTYRLYIDGVMVGSSTTLRNIYSSSADKLSVGATMTGVFPINGWVDELRFTIGAARYASNAGYTVATSAFPRS